LKNKIKCEICGKTFEKLATHLTRTHNITVEDYYLKYMGEVEYCPKCGKKCRFDGLTRGYWRTCGNISCSAATWVRDKDYCDLMSKIMSGVGTRKWYIDRYGEKEGLNRRMLMRVNKSYAASLSGYIDRYGVEEGTKRFNSKIYDRGSLKYFISKYGSALGPKRYMEQCAKIRRALSKEGFIERYGEEEGRRRYEAMRMACSPRLQAYINKYGDTDIARILYKQRIKTISEKCGWSLEKYINRYGVVEGTRKYKETKRAVYLSKETLIEKYGEEEGRRRWQSFLNKLKGQYSLDWFKKRYDTELEALQAYAKMHWHKQIKSKEEFYEYAKHYRAGGYDPEFRNANMRLKLLQEQNFQCALCGVHYNNYSGKFHLHHIDYNKRNNNPDNLVWLCNSCHSKTNCKNTEYFIELLTERKKRYAGDCECIAS